MSFHNVRISEDVERGAIGGPRFRTRVLSLVSGHENRNIEWQRTRARWDIGYGLDGRQALFTEVINFFYARRGMAYGFRFKDWVDYTLGVDAIDSPQVLGVGDDAQQAWQCYKTYSDTGGSFDRNITRLVTGTIRYFEDGVEVFTNWSADVDTGILTRTPALAVDVIPGVICEYDVPVRFDTDDLDISVVHYDALEVPSIPIIELREGS